MVRAEPFVVRGSFGFGLKSLAKALKAHGHVDAEWKDGPTDGLGAMVAAWWCEDQALGDRVTLSDYELMQEVVRYNEVDCKVMMEIIEYLRRN